MFVLTSEWSSHKDSVRETMYSYIHVTHCALFTITLTYPCPISNGDSASVAVCVCLRVQTHTLVVVLGHWQVQIHFTLFCTPVNTSLLRPGYSQPRLLNQTPGTHTHKHLHLWLSYSAWDIQLAHVYGVVVCLHWAESGQKSGSYWSGLLHPLHSPSLVCFVEHKQKEKGAEINVYLRL